MQKRNFSQSDETKTFDLGMVNVVSLGGITFGRFTLQPGWKWSTSVKPIAKTMSCEVSHLQYVISGRLHVVMDDGTEADYGPGDLASIPPGHNAWVLGNEPFVGLEVSGAVEYARKAA